MLPSTSSGVSPLPTSGVSTTPYKARAEYYALAGGAGKTGVVYVIDTSVLVPNHVRQYDVNAIVPMPSVPEDEEVILVADDYGALPPEIITQIYECST